MRREGESGHLLRVLGVAFGVAAVIGGTIGQGILRSPGVVAAGVPDARIIILLWVLGGVVAIIDAMSTVELAASIRRTGAGYAFITRAFGRFAGIVTGLAIWLGYVGVIAFVSVIFGEYLHRLGIATFVPVGAIALIVLGAIGGIQALGTRVSGVSQEAVSAVKALIFVALIFALLLAPRGAPVIPAVPAPAMTLLGLIVAIRAIVGTYLGWENAAFYGEEIKDAARSITRATFGGIALVTVIYVLVNVALLSVLSPQEMAGSPLVAADAAGRAFGPTADMIVTGVSLISLVSIINTAMMTFPRLIFAIARDSGIPILSRVAANGSPQYALALMVAVSALFSLIGVYAILLAFSVWLTTCVAATVNVAAITMRRNEPDLDRPYRMPLFPLPAVFAFCVNTALLAGFLYESPWIAVQATVLVAVLAGGVWAATRGSATVSE